MALRSRPRRSSARRITASARPRRPHRVLRHPHRLRARKTRRVAAPSRSRHVRPLPSLRLRPSLCPSCCELTDKVQFVLLDVRLSLSYCARSGSRSVVPSPTSPLSYPLRIYLPVYFISWTLRTITTVRTLASPSSPSHHAASSIDIDQPGSCIPLRCAILFSLPLAGLCSSHETLMPLAFLCAPYPVFYPHCSIYPSSSPLFSPLRRGSCRVSTSMYIHT